MLQFFAILFTVFLLGWIPYASAAQDDEQQTQQQGVESMSEQGSENSNSPATGDQVKGEDRASERHSMEHGSDTTNTPESPAKKDMKKSK